MSERRIIAGEIQTPPEMAPHGFRDTYCVKCGFNVKVPISCNKKTCVPCQERRSISNYFRVSEGIKKAEKPEGYYWQHIVFTQVQQKEIRYGTSRIIRAFSRLRKEKFWKYCVWGGYYTVECKRSKDGKGWHIHIHAAVLARRIEFSVIYQKWGKHIKHSKPYIFMEAIRFKNMDGNIVGYIVRYLTKKANVTEELETEYNNGMAGRHLISPFGKMYGKVVKSKLGKATIVCPRCHGTEWIDFDTVHRMELKADRVRGPTQEENTEWTPEIYEQQSRSDARGVRI